MIKGLFGPSMTKPFRKSNGEIIFFIAGGAMDTKKTEIYQYLEANDGRPNTWHQIQVDLKLNIVGFSFFFFCNSDDTNTLILGGGLQNDFITTSKSVKVINLDNPASIKENSLTEGDYFYDN